MQFKYAVTAAVIGLSLAGCQRTAYNDNYSAPPLQAQPVPSVQSSQLPPVNGADGSQYPAAPTNAPNAGNPGQQQAMAASAMDVTKESMVGSWKVSNGGSSCDMFLTLTNLGSGSRGGTRGCAGELTSMGSWEVSGKQVLLKNRDGSTIGTLYKTADARFDGSTASGQPISLSR
ncbi:AprI/Inh family metalloprotease inhibitor [Rhizobium sp. P38BS-XIX]|uniref:protease inhibitor Inh/omp19 family protein n=1 Tax=Rhizobium sp. P38BS-XIX TaxID=2726740 RepID=UPI001456CD0A|nr:protease inhibitor Inh/omp19 family protein [Rhizobium sp. P38BS-XIX]NLR99148.1 AprI/Inh family metalloprotease inhibitor [Rhizobium sp. P38BS-XIX]